MSLRAIWRKTVFGGLVVGCAGVTLQCGGGSSSTPSAEAGAAGEGTAGHGTAAAGAAGSSHDNAGSAGVSHPSGGGTGEEAGGTAGMAQVTAGSGGKGAGTAGTAGALGNAGSSVGGNASNAGSSGAGGAGSGGLEVSGGTGGIAGSAGSAGTAGNNGGATSGGSSGSNGVAGSSGFGGSIGVGGSSGVAGSGAAGSAGTAGSSTGGSGGSAGASGSGGAGGACSGSSAVFRPRTPVVYFLLDRSSSMFLPTDYWSPTKASVLSTINAYASQIRFGLAAYTGVIAQTCPLDLTVAGGIAVDNYANINQVLAPLGSPGVKAESPTAAALSAVRTSVLAESGSSKTVFLITDGGHDFCNDAVAACAGDALVAQLQSNFGAGIQTSVFGIKGSPYLDLTQTQAYANAGSGAPAVGDSLNTYYMCNGETPWHSLWLAKGSPANQALGSYVASGSSNTPYTLLDTTQPDAMTSALKAATAALKSCTYDLSGAQVNQALAGQGVVRIDGVSVPMNASNGWRLNSSTELELVGTACANWRTAAAQTISFEFSCSILNP